MEEKTMGLYRYYLTSRPPSLGTHPQGTSTVVSYDKRTDGCWGYVEYEKPLTKKQVSDYELEYEEPETNPPKGVLNAVGFITLAHFVDGIKDIVPEEARLVYSKERGYIVEYETEDAEGAIELRTHYEPSAMVIIKRGARMSLEKLGF